MISSYRLDIKEKRKERRLTFDALEKTSYYSILSACINKNMIGITILNIAIVLIIIE